jgi:hypothetical protein
MGLAGFWREMKQDMQQETGVAIGFVLDQDMIGVEKF